MASEENPFAALSLVGGRLCLDFANTAGEHVPEVRDEKLTSYADLAWWAARAGAIPETEVDSLLRLAAERPEAAAAVHARALELREALFRCFSSRAAGEPVAGADLDVVNRELAGAMAHVRLVPADGPCEWDWADSDALERVLWPIARSAAEVLTAEEVDRVKQCAGESCDWVYLDTSRNRSRRWCDMKECGNRAKARRHYHRHRASE